MLVVSDRIVELNPFEQAAAVAVRFPFNQFTVKRVKHNYLRVTFHSSAQRDMWARKIMDAVPADARPA